MTELEAVRLFKCLADKSRLQILKSLVREDMYVELLSERLGLSASTVSFHLKKLSEIGAVTSYKTQYYTMYSLDKAAFNLSLLDIIQEESSEAAVQAEREQAYRSKVLSSFLDEEGKLRTIPAQRKKRLIVLERIAEEFEGGRVYSEREANLIIASFHDDFCTIRREMVDEGLLTRENGQYSKVIASLGN